jgi:hypothetical protein
LAIEEMLQCVANGSLNGLELACVACLADLGLRTVVDRLYDTLACEILPAIFSVKRKDSPQAPLRTSGEVGLWVCPMFGTGQGGPPLSSAQDTAARWQLLSGEDSLLATLALPAADGHGTRSRGVVSRTNRTGVACRNADRECPQGHSNRSRGNMRTRTLLAPPTRHLLTVLLCCSLPGSNGANRAFTTFTGFGVFALTVLAAGT